MRVRIDPIKKHSWISYEYFLKYYMHNQLKPIKLNSLAKKDT